MSLSCRDHSAMGHCCSGKQASCSVRETEATTASSVDTYVSNQPVYDKFPVLMSGVKITLALCGTPVDLLCPAAPAKSRATACILLSGSSYKAQSQQGALSRKTMKPSLNHLCMVEASPICCSNPNNLRCNLSALLFRSTKSGMTGSLCHTVTCMGAGQAQQMTMQSGPMHQMCPAGRSSATTPKSSGRSASLLAASAWKGSAMQSLTHTGPLWLERHAHLFNCFGRADVMTCCALASVAAASHFTTSCSGLRTTAKHSAVCTHEGIVMPLQRGFARPCRRCCCTWWGLWTGCLQHLPC